MQGQGPCKNGAAGDKLANPEATLMEKPELATQPRHLARALLVAVAIFGFGALAIWGFIEGREELAREAERERPVKAPQRISLEANAIS